MTVVAGITSIYATNNLEYKVDRAFFHQNFTIPRHYDDIALIRVNGVLKFDDEIRPVLLPTWNFDNVGREVVLTGWGRVDVSSNLLMSCA